jgi:hypothetical protein
MYLQIALPLHAGTTIADYGATRRLGTELEPISILLRSPSMERAEDPVLLRREESRMPFVAEHPPVSLRTEGFDSLPFALKVPLA